MMGVQVSYDEAKFCAIGLMVMVEKFLFGVSK